MTMTLAMQVRGRDVRPSVHPHRSAAQRLYDAEVALHYARQSGVDAWIAAAYERLHDAGEASLADLPSPPCATSDSLVDRHGRRS